MNITYIKILDWREALKHGQEGQVAPNHTQKKSMRLRRNKRLLCCDYAASPKQTSTYVNCGCMLADDWRLVWRYDDWTVFTLHLGITCFKPSAVPASKGAHVRNRNRRWKQEQTWHIYRMLMEVNGINLHYSWTLLNTLHFQTWWWTRTIRWGRFFWGRELRNIMCFLYIFPT